MMDEKIYDFNTKDALKWQISAFNEGFEMGVKAAKEEYERK